MSRPSARWSLLGNTVATNLFPDGDAVGKQVQLGHTPFTVIGVLAPKGQTANGTDQDDVVLVPYTTAQDRLSGFSFLGQILASTASASDMAAAQDEIRAIMREVAHAGRRRTGRLHGARPDGHRPGGDEHARR